MATRRDDTQSGAEAHALQTRCVPSAAPPPRSVWSACASAPLCVRLALAVLLAWIGLTNSANIQAAEVRPDAPVALSARPPRLRPDYVGVVIPPNVAPLNFHVDEPGRQHRVRLEGANGPPVEVVADAAGKVILPIAAWRTLLRTNVGLPLRYTVQTLSATGTWELWAPVTNTVAREPVDPVVVYRRLRPLYNFYREMGIYQRDLESYRQSPVLESRHFGGGCLNCHTFLDHRPDTFALHIRGQKGPQPMLLVRSNAVTRVNQTAGYLAWHPGGEWLAFSANRLSLFFHTRGETRDVFDAESNLGLYGLHANAITRPAAVADPAQLETWPRWAPDGRHLYFASARPLRVERFRQVRYDVRRVAFDLATDTWGEPETVVAAAEAGFSATQPRISPDGRWLLYCRSRYGHFPIYQPDSDLHVLDLQTGHSRRLDVNSDQADTWPCWSSNGRWIVFSSKRGTGLFARPHFSYVDAEGRFHKPFVLPQRDPTFYDACLETFNVPEFVTGPIQVSSARLARAVMRPAHVLEPSNGVGQTHHEEQIAPRPPE